MVQRRIQLSTNLYGDPVHAAAGKVAVLPGCVSLLDGSFAPERCSLHYYLSPFLFLVAQCVLSAPATSMKVERVNSAAAIIESNRRRSQTPEPFQSYVPGQQYMRQYFKGRVETAEFLADLGAAVVEV